MKEVKLDKRTNAKGNIKENHHDENKTVSDRLDTPNILSGGSYIFTFILLIITLLIYDLTLVSPVTIDLKSVKADLLNNVYNQNDSLYVILDSLNQMLAYEPKVQIVNFIGSTGVGKTFIANILKRHFHVVHEFNMPVIRNSQQKIVDNIKYNFNHNLVIVEDLKESDMDDLLVFVKEIPQDLVALVICIFNIQETDDELNHNINYKNIDKINQKFNKADIPYKVAKFHEFDKSQAREWVMKQLTQKGINLVSHSQIIESVLTDQDIKYHGLKGLISKINLEL